MEGTQEPPRGGRGTDPDELSSPEWEEGAGWGLWIGPGARLDRLAPLLEGLEQLGLPGENGPARLADLEDLALCEAPERGRLVLDGDALPAEDLGYLRRFLERTPGFELVLIGEAPGRGTLRRLPARWIAWPPDLFELEELAAPPEGAAGDDAPSVHAPRARALPGGREVGRADDAPAVREAFEHDEDRGDDDRDRDDAPPEEPPPLHAAPQQAPRAEREPPTRPVVHARGLGADEARELAAIQAVLDLPPLPTDLELDDETAFGASDQDPFGVLQDVPTLEDDETDDPGPDASELDPFARPHERAHAPAQARPAVAAPVATPGTARSTTGGAAPSGTSGPSAPPAYYRAQIADLADIAQRVDLALRALRPEPDRAAPPDDGYEPLAAEVARLLQFTRTLSYLVAPPPRGTQAFDLGVLVEEVLDQTVVLGPEAPRCVFRRADDLVVRSDKGLLVQALDAFVVLALACAGPGELIRVQVRPAPGADGRGGTARLSLEFPSGALADLAPERIAEPYALRTRLPSFGPNALSAASGIVAGQGGAVRLARSGEARLELTVDLPLA